MHNFGGGKNHMQDWDWGLGKWGGGVPGDGGDVKIKLIKGESRGKFSHN